MNKDILDKIYNNELYLEYLRYHPKWYVILNDNPNLYSEFEKEVKTKYKITTYDKIENFKKQIDFVNGIVKYLNSY